MKDSSVAALLRNDIGVAGSFGRKGEILSPSHVLYERGMNTIKCSAYL